ncbi:phosphoadenosine phosphosulfate reductase [Formivibrio citricus]|uniref:Adenosine 5'-phosphosulfate reductase n=1 Tax=Formivibrio citricus TaxID=83765 RepID=A0A1I4XPQ7_9NEIS|nr:phosphoadenylyl-sulfate reductase [Formivibrio citricus]SFN27403.1 phosphoadenosine phosphosulfate reductase [Formivibrio citricus]
MSGLSPELQGRIEAAEALLRRIATEFAPATLANSLGAEDMALTDLVARLKLPIGLFTLETGRLHKETLDTLARAEAHYGITIERFQPEAADVEAYVRDHGLNAMYESVELRKRCCEIRKVKPLQRALAGKKAWITGLRRAQAVTRTALPLQEFDSTHGLEKFSPLADWSEEDVWAYIEAFNVPFNPLHQRGYPSIGCEPCTRAIRPGEDIRAGRWWWESSDSKECGLHVKPAKE